MMYNETSVNASIVIDDETGLGSPPQPPLYIDTYIVYFYIAFLAQGLIELFGIITNTINIIVFLKFGMKDSVSVSLFAIAIADHLYLTIALMSNICTTADRIFLYRPYVHLNILAYLVSWGSSVCQDVSILLTIYLAVQKCACVTIPLVFKNVFTARRSMYVTLATFIITFASYIPIFTNQGMAQGFHHAINRTRLMFWYTDDVVQVIAIRNILNRVLLPTSAQVIIVLCVILMVYKLKQASAFRRSNQVVEDADNANDKDADKPLGLDKKEQKVVKAVVLVSAVFIICNTPLVMLSLASVIFPEFSDVQTALYYSLYQLYRVIQRCIIQINSGVNIFIYLAYNSRYRRVFLSGIRRFSSINTQSSVATTSSQVTT